MIRRLYRYSSTALLIGLFLGASVIGVMSEIYRLESKGANYSLTTWNDAYYYRSMASDLWSKPRSIGHDLEAAHLFPLSPAVEVQRARNYDASSIHAMYLHEENGLAHQGPYAFRILLPSVVALLHGIGMSANVGFLVVYCLGFGLLALFSYRTICAAEVSAQTKSRKPFLSRTGLCVSTGLIMAVAATTSPSYPDSIYLGLSMLAVWAAISRKAAVFVIAATSAVLARETGAILGLFWLLSVWDKGQFKSLLKSPRAAAPAVAPLLAFLVSRGIVMVPDNRVHYEELFQALFSWRTLTLGLGAILLVCLFAPATTLSLLPSKQCHIDIRDALIIACAAGYVLLTMLLSTNTSRMALLVAPLIIGTGAWKLAKSILWVIGLTAAPLAYLFCEQVSPQMGSVGKVLMWPIAAGIVLTIQLIAAQRESRETS